MNNAGSTHEGDFHAVELNAAPRRAKAKRLAAVLASVLSLVFSACSTPGPAHGYLYSPTLGNTVRDIDPRTGRELAVASAYVETGERVVGLAYDPYTDHLFLRIFPGNFVRVVDRPANAVKRTFRAPSLPLGGHDFAVRSRDRHFFFSSGNEAALIRTNLDGELRELIPLAGLSAPVWGVAHDAERDELLVLADEVSERVHRFGLDGAARGEVELQNAVLGVSLAYEARTRTYFASLADGSAIGVFDAEGRLLRRLPRPSAEREVFIDIGERSLVRMF
jgi:hypothetical protein